MERVLRMAQLLVKSEYPQAEPGDYLLLIYLSTDLYAEFGDTLPRLCFFI